MRIMQLNMSKRFFCFSSYGLSGLNDPVHGFHTGNGCQFIDDFQIQFSSRFDFQNELLMTVSPVRSPDSLTDYKGMKLFLNLLLVKMPPPFRKLSTDNGSGFRASYWKQSIQSQ